MMKYAPTNSVKWISTGLEPLTTHTHTKRVCEPFLQPGALSVFIHIVSLSPDGSYLRTFIIKLKLRTLLLEDKFETAVTELVQ